MRVTGWRVVSLDYLVRLGSGQVVETSMGKNPIEYVHGGGQILPALERALEGLREGGQAARARSRVAGICLSARVIDQLQPASRFVRSPRRRVGAESCERVPSRRAVAEVPRSDPEHPQRLLPEQRGGEGARERLAREH